MPTVSHSEQSFLLDGRPFWVLAASLQYARIVPEQWRSRIRDARQAGFNTIETACPWMIHEPREGRYEFEGNADIRTFIEMCAEEDLKVILRLGPAIGSAFNGSGIPGWILERSDIKPRQSGAPFMGLYSQYLRKLLNHLEGMSATSDGPVIMAQSEHAWTCANPDEVAPYHKELARYIREAGFNVPILNANDLWQAETDTIDTWRGWDDLLVHLRQIRAVHPDKPRLVSSFEAADAAIWGDEISQEKTADAMLVRMAEILAAGAQMIVSPFHAGTNFGFLGGRAAGRSDGFVTTAAASAAPLGEAGHRSEKFLMTKRIVTFANHFAHVFTDLSPDFHPIVLDPAQVVESKTTGDTSAPHGPVAIVPQRGANGRVVFVFGGGDVKHTTLLLDDGLRMNVDLGDQSVAWFVFDVDLKGTARLDYVNLCPWAIVDRSILVLYGPEKTIAQLSINDNALEAPVPSGNKPTVIAHRGITVVICNPKQIDATYHDDECVYVGVEGLDEDGKPILPVGGGKAWAIRRDAEIKPIKVTKARVREVSSPNPIKLGKWTRADNATHVTAESPRFASLKGPESLADCGAATGYGWYRIQLNSSSIRKRLCHLPFAGDRLHLFAGGKLSNVIGHGPGAERGPFELKLAKGEQSLVVLADNLGRFHEGNDFARPKGMCGHLYEIKTISAARPKPVKAKPVDPFVLRGFIAGAARGQGSEIEQTEWTFTHARKSSILIDVRGATCTGTFVLNDEPLTYYAGHTGALDDRILLERDVTESFKRGKNVLRFAPDPYQTGANEDIGAAVKIYECVENLSADASWFFAKWEAPMPTDFEPSDAASKPKKGQPAWWKTRFAIKADDAERPAAWLDTTGLSKGQAYVNGHDLGRYFTATAKGKAVGPQVRLFIPDAWLKTLGSNEVILFDEHGFDPFKTKIVFSETGDF